MPDATHERLIAAIWETHDRAIDAQREAAEAGDTEALQVLAIVREWLRITLRRHGEDTIRQD